MTSELAVREAVRSTITRYAVAGDRGRLEELASCFTPDGTLELRDSWSATGREAIVAQLTATSSNRNRIDADGFFIRHFVTNIDFQRVTTSEVRTTAYFQVLTPLGLDHWGRYRDVFVPHGGRWLFQRRLVRVDARTAHTLT